MEQLSDIGYIFVMKLIDYSNYVIFYFDEQFRKRIKENQSNQTRILVK